MSDDELPDGIDVRSIVFTRKLLKKLIAMYRSFPCLWDRNDEHYKLKFKRHEAITQLTELVQQYDATATRVHVLRKIESLRACVRREHKRVRDSRRMATTEEQVYKPQLWYYDLFSFVFNTDEGTSCTSDSMKMNESKVEHLSSEEENENTYEGPPHFEVSLDTGDYSVASNMVEVADNSGQNYHYDDDRSSKRQCTEVADEYDAIGVNVAAKLRNLPMNMRILAEKLINDVLFQAQLNGLSPSTSISTPDPIKQDPL